VVSPCVSYSDAEVYNSLTANGDVAADAEDVGDDSETEGQSSDDGDVAGDIDELLDEALDEDAEENSIRADTKSSMTTDSAAAAAEPVSCDYYFTALLACATDYFSHPVACFLAASHSKSGSINIQRCSSANCSFFQQQFYLDLRSL